MTLPKGFKPKSNKKDKEENSKSIKVKEYDSDDSSEIKVTAATVADFVNKEENKIVTDNISPKEEVTVDDILVDEDSAIITTVTATPATEGEVRSETALKVPLQRNNNEVESETELKVISFESSSFGTRVETPQEITNPSTISTQNNDENEKRDEGRVASSRLRQEEKEAISKALDETKDNIRKTTDEARRDIPRYTQAVNEYHEQTIQAARDIADNYLDSQKEIINSYQSAWIPQVENTYSTFWNYWMSPRHFVDNYTRVVSSFADNSIAATRLVNNTIFASLEGFKTSVQNTRDNAKEFSRIGVNAARSFTNIKTRQGNQELDEDTS
jgi:predicted secreted protein